MHNISMNIHPSPIMHHIWNFHINQIVRFFLEFMPFNSFNFISLDTAGEAVPQASAAADAVENELGNVF